MTDTAPPPRASRCWSLAAPDGSIDVEVAARGDAALAAVLPELAALLGVDAVELWAGSTRLSPDLRLDAPELLHGAVLGVGGPGPRPEGREAASALELHVVGGPDAGRTVALTQGEHVLGRGGGASIALSDPDVSRRHASVRVGGGEIVVADPASTNGTTLDGVGLGPVPRAWPVGGLLRLGATSLTVTGPTGCPATVRGAPGGRLAVRPGPRLVGARPELEVGVPGPPDERPARRLAWVGVVLPIAGGVAMAGLLHTPTFLFFTVLGPMVAVGTWLSDRWSGRRTRRRELAAHAAEVAAGERRLAAAIHADRRAAHAQHPDLARLCSAVRRRSALLWSRRPDDADALVLRLGTGPGPTRITVIEDGGTRTRRHAADLPVTLDLRTDRGLGVVGPRHRAMSVLRAAIAQLTALHAPDCVDLLLLTERRRLAEWSWARWLPHLDPRAVLAEDDDIASRLPALLARSESAASSSARWLVVLVDRSVDAALAARLRDAGDARVLALSVAESAEGLPATGAALLRVGGEVGCTATLHRPGTPEIGPFVLDGLEADLAAHLARGLAPLVPQASAGSVPERVRLLDQGTDAVHLDACGRAAGRWSRTRSSLTATLGRAAEGPVTIDLCRVGPHALLAGTTGSGKSELLQSLIASLALNHAPDRCSFLLVDYKGGAAFAQAAALPHTVGILTDLDGSTTARALRSLAAEVTRREAILAAHRVSDLTGLPDSADLARLVIVVDEFATLAEELPEFLPGLVGIAQRGRSLGIHLVLATQRPGGVVSPEIRANCTLRICLRTTDEAESRDVLGIPDAAHIPLDLPGRAILRTGGDRATVLQVARVSATPDDDAGVEARRWHWPAAQRSPSGRRRPGAGTDLARIAAALQRLAADTALPRPHRPWLPPLPDRLALEEVHPGHAADVAGDAKPSPGGAIRLPIGLVDRPEAQAQEPLELDLADGGGWLAVGGPRSGRTTLLRTVLAAAVRALPPDELHVHVLDHGGGALAAEAAELPHTGTAVGGHDPLRTTRLLDRLAGEIGARRSGAHAGTRPRMLLLVDGAEALLAQLDEADPSTGSAMLLRLIRDGAAAGLTCVLTADRAVPGSRLAAVVSRRLVLPLADRADYAIAGIRAGDVPAHRPPGRALYGEDATACQVALPPERPWPAATTPGSSRPPGFALRIAELPADPERVGHPPADPLTTATGTWTGTSTGTGLRVVLGPGGDEGHLLTVDLAAAGGLLVVGPPGSGRSSTLEALAADLERLGVRLLRVGAVPPPAGTGMASSARWVAAHDTAGLQEWLATLEGRPGAVLADDVGLPPEWPTLAAVPSRSPSAPVVLLASGSAACLAAHYQGPVGILRRHRTGLLLCPGAAEAEVLGIRPPRTPVPHRPGSGWLLTGGTPQRVQVARLREAPAPGGADGQPAPLVGAPA